jgi:hypothetical protein
VNSLARTFQTLWQLVKLEPESERVEQLAAHFAALVGQWREQSVVAAIQLEEIPRLLGLALILAPFGVVLGYWRRKDGYALVYAQVDLDPEPDPFAGAVVIPHQLEEAA